MARKGKLRHLAEYAALRLALGFFGTLGLDRASAVGGWLGRTVGPRVGVTNRARRNIALAMPELGADEVERIYTVKKLQKNNFEANKACLEVQNKTLDVCISKSFSFLMKAFTNQAKPFQTKYALVRLVAEQEEAEART